MGRGWPEQAGWRWTLCVTRLVVVCWRYYPGRKVGKEDVACRSHTNPKSSNAVLDPGGVEGLPADGVVAAGLFRVNTRGCFHSAGPCGWDQHDMALVATATILSSTWWLDQARDDMLF